MKAEDKYKMQLVELGVWQDAFKAEVHTLCMMERELRREQKAWRDAAAALKAGADPEDGEPEDGDPADRAKLLKAVDPADRARLLKAVDAHYSLILTLRRDILAHRDALGLTPKGLQRLRGKEVGMPDGAAAPSARQVSDAFAALKARCESYEG